MALPETKSKVITEVNWPNLTLLSIQMGIIMMMHFFIGKKRNLFL